MALMNWADMCFGKTCNWQKLSNSGEPLKNIVPSYSRKTISGQNNYLGTVISYIMKETEMGNRGSKSSLFTSNSKSSKGVKEQRVDGS